MSWAGLSDSLGGAGATTVVALMIGHLYCCFRYHHSEARPDGIFAPVSGLAERRSKSGHCTSLTTFSAIDPNTNGCHPEMPCVEMTTMSICSRSTTSMMFPAKSFPTSTLELDLTPLAKRAA